MAVSVEEVALVAELLVAKNEEAQRLRATDPGQQGLPGLRRMAVIVLPSLLHVLPMVVANLPNLVLQLLQYPTGTTTM